MAFEAADVVRVVARLEAAGVGCWLSGGWAVDAVLGKQTREHQALDLVLGLHDLPRLLGALADEGFAVANDRRPVSLDLVAPGGSRVDLHLVSWTEAGGEQARPDGGARLFPARGFVGRGLVGGREVPCLTAEVQILDHDGYDLDSSDLRDLDLLRSALDGESAAVRAHWRDLVRRGYDEVSEAYRDDGGESATGPDDGRREAWLDELAPLLPPQSRVLDLGCGAGLPTAKRLVRLGFSVLGVDISTVQIERARKLVPDARFVQADMVEWPGERAAFDAVVSFYALIHVPLEDQRTLLPRLRTWLRPGGHLMAVLGARRWTGVEHYLGAPMFWDHADPSTYRRWLAEAGFEVISDRFVPEDAKGHQLFLARASETS